MYINKISIKLSDDNFKILNDLASREIVTNIDLTCYEDEIIINIYDKNTFFRLNNELKCLGILYNTLGIKANKEDIIEQYHHLLN